MCEPTTLAIASLVAGVAATGMQAVGAAQQGQAASRQAQYQAQVADNNATIQRGMAADALQRGEVAEQQQREKTAQQISTQRAALASSGTDVNSGSNVNIQGDTAAAGEFDALTIRGNAAREAYGDTVNAMSDTATAGLDRSKASAAEDAGMFGAGADLLSGASSVSNKWLSYKTGKNPVFGG
jgi:hypothetical protein